MPFIKQGEIKGGAFVRVEKKVWKAWIIIDAQLIIAHIKGHMPSLFLYISYACDQGHIRGDWDVGGLSRRDDDVAARQASSNVVFLEK